MPMRGDETATKTPWIRYFREGLSLAMAFARLPVTFDAFADKRESTCGFVCNVILDYAVLSSKYIRYVSFPDASRAAP